MQQQADSDAQNEKHCHYRIAQKPLYLQHIQRVYKTNYKENVFKKINI